MKRIRVYHRSAHKKGKVRIPHKNKIQNRTYRTLDWKNIVLNMKLKYAVAVMTLRAAVGKLFNIL